MLFLRKSLPPFTIPIESALESLPHRPSFDYEIFALPHSLCCSPNVDRDGYDRCRGPADAYAMPARDDRHHYHKIIDRISREATAEVPSQSPDWKQQQSRDCYLCRTARGAGAP